MAISQEEYKEKMIQQTLDYHGLTTWHKLGHKGKGVKILLLEDIHSTSGHGKMVRDRLLRGLPEAEVHWILPQFGLKNDVLYNFKASNDDVVIDDLETFEQFVNYYDIITVSRSTFYGSQLGDIFREKICITSAGNEEGGKVTRAFRGYGLQITSIRLVRGKPVGTYYASQGELVDFACLTFDKKGTSFASPVMVDLAGLIVERYGNRFSTEDIRNIFKDKDLIIDAGDEGQDDKFGYGVPIILPPDEMDKKIKRFEFPKPKPEPEPEVPEVPKKESSKMYMYLVRYAHLDKIHIKIKDVCQADILWNGKLSPATKIGIEGNTGLSTGRHTHIDVVKVPYDPNFRYKKYRQIDIYNGNPPADKTELYYFIDETLYKDKIKITTHYLSKTYEKQFGRVHPAVDVVSLGKKTLYWNRSTRGRVVHTGYDNAYGDYVVIAYFDISFDSYVGEEINKENNLPIKIEGENDLSATWQNKLKGYMYHMLNGSKIKSKYGQSKKFDGNVRYIEVHPNNLGIIDSLSKIEDSGFAGINGTFFWYEDKEGTKSYPVSILKVKNKVLREDANHFPYPQGVLCYYQDGTFGIEQVKEVNEISKPVWWAIGGIEYVRDSKVTYNVTAEGFIGDFADVHRRTTHASVGLTKDGKILLARHWNSTRAESTIHMKEMGCIYAIGLDGGGSTQYQVPNAKRLSNRKVDHLLVATDLKI